MINNPDTIHQNQINNNEFNNNQEEQNKKDENRTEKIILIYIIIINIILIFISIFFIHDIISRGVARDTKTIGITYPDKPIDEDVIINYTDRFVVMQDYDGKSWDAVRELDMFKNSNFYDKNKIAPGVEGNYSFSVENESDATFSYDMFFTPENPYNVNMVYKLKKNGQYVLGNQEKWETYTGLEKKLQTLNPHSKDIYTVEWRWEDTDYDTEIGETYGAYYRMYINILAEQIAP